MSNGGRRLSTVILAIWALTLGVRVAWAAESEPKERRHDPQQAQPADGGTGTGTGTGTGASAGTGTGSGGDDGQGHYYTSTDQPDQTPSRRKDNEKPAQKEDDETAKFLKKNPEVMAPVTAALAESGATPEHVGNALRELIRKNPELLMGQGGFDRAKLEKLLAQSGVVKEEKKEMVKAALDALDRERNPALVARIPGFPRVIGQLHGTNAEEQQKGVETVLASFRGDEATLAALPTADLLRQLYLDPASPAGAEIARGLDAMRAAYAKAREPDGLHALDYQGRTDATREGREAGEVARQRWEASPVAQAFAKAGAPQARGRLVEAVARLDDAVKKGDWAAAAAILDSDLMGPWMRDRDGHKALVAQLRGSTDPLAQLVSRYFNDDGPVWRKDPNDPDAQKYAALDQAFWKVHDENQKKWAPWFDRMSSGRFTAEDTAYFRSLWTDGKKADLDAELQHAAQRYEAALRMNDQTAMLAWANRFNAILAANPQAQSWGAPGVAVHDGHYGTSGSQYYVKVPAGEQPDRVMRYTADRRQRALAGEKPITFVSGPAPVPSLVTASYDPPAPAYRPGPFAPAGDWGVQILGPPGYDFARRSSQYPITYQDRGRVIRGVLTIDSQGRWSLQSVAQDRLFAGLGGGPRR